MIRLFVVVIGLLIMLALPAAAQRPYVEGRVAATAPHQATLTVYVTVASPDAPGKVPEKYAALAAKLADQAQQLQQQGNFALASQVLAKVRQLRCQREVTFVVREQEPITIVGITTSTLDTVTKGMRLMMEVSAPGPVQTWPSRAALIGAAQQVDAHTPCLLHPLPRGPKDPNSYFQLTGIVLDADPVTLDIEGRQLIIDDPHALGYFQQTPLMVSDLKADQPLLAWGTRVDANMHMMLAKTSRLIVYTGTKEIPYDQLAHMAY